MKSFRLTAIASSVGLLFSGASAFATDLPPYVKDIAASINSSVATDGSVVVGNTRYVPILPPGYDSTKMPSGTSGDMKLQADGSVVFPGDLQMVPIIAPPGEMPTLPENFKPAAAGATLPPDFLPPNGFSAPQNMPLPTGVKVPPKPPAEMVADMEKAGLLPVGLVKFNADGTIQVSGTSFLPFVPPAAQQGLQSAGAPKFIRSNSDGSVTLPDGTVFAPVVPGSKTGETTLPKGFTPPANTSLPTSVNLPTQFAIPPTMQIPPGTTLPSGVSIPENYYLPPGTKLPAGVTLPASVTKASDVMVPPGITLPPGTKIDTANLPVGTTVLPNGSVVIPGAEIPSGVKPPSNWVPPSGVTADGKGGYFVPPPPANGYPAPTAPNSVNSDGSMVMAGLPAGAQAPADWKKNTDGTYTVPPPAFIGQVAAGGTIQAPTNGYTPPTDFKAQLPGGATTLTTFDPKGTLDSSGKIVNMPAPPAGFVQPAGWTKNVDGTYQTSAPADFKPVTQNADGSMTVMAPFGSGQLPPGAKLNTDGTMTLQAPTAMVGCQPPACLPPAGAPTTGLAPPPQQQGSTIKAGEIPPMPPGFVAPTFPNGTQQPGTQPPNGTQGSPGTQPSTGTKPSTGTPSTGGTPPAGGTPSSGGTPGGPPPTGGMPTSGGTSGGTPPAGGSPPSGGTSGGTPYSGGVPTSGGTPGGSPPAGGTPSSGGTSGGGPSAPVPPAGGMPSSGGTSGGAPSAPGPAPTGPAPTGPK